MLVLNQAVGLARDDEASEGRSGDLWQKGYNMGRRRRNGLRFRLGGVVPTASAAFLERQQIFR